MTKNTIDSTMAPVQACLFNETLSFAESDAKPGFSIVGYSGEIIKDHWYWGNIAFDLSGMKFAKARTPVLEEHFTSSRIGFATKQEIGEKVTFEGQFLQNDRAVAMAGDLKAGFPMEASLYIRPSIIEQVAEGASVEVNGRTLAGPGAVFRKAVIKEVSMCVFGADSNTESVAAGEGDAKQVKFNLVKEKDKMGSQNESAKPMTMLQFKADHEALYNEIFAAGAGAEIERFGRLQKACGDDTELLVKCFAEKLDTAAAQTARIEKLTAANTVMAQQLAQAKPAEAKADPAVGEFTNQPRPGYTPPNPPAAFDEDKATDAQLKEHFAGAQELQDKFSSADAYVAYVKHKDPTPARS